MYSCTILSPCFAARPWVAFYDLAFRRRFNLLGSSSRGWVLSSRFSRSRLPLDFLRGASGVRFLESRFLVGGVVVVSTATAAVDGAAACVIVEVGAV